MSKPKSLEALSVSEASKILHMDSRWVEAQCRTKKIKACKLGHYWRIAPEHLIEYLEEAMPFDDMAPAWKLAIVELKARTGGENIES